MRFFRKFFRKESRTARLGVTRGVGGQKWTDRRYETFAKEAYMKNVIAFRCIFEIATSVSSAGWNLFSVDADGEQELVPGDHWIKDLMLRTSPQDSFGQFLTRSVSFLLLSGITFIERVALDTGANAGVVRELYTHRPDRMKFLLSGGRVVGYAYTEGSEKVMWPVDPINGASDMLVIKAFHPLDDLLGMSMIDPAAREIDTSNEAIAWNKSLLENQGRPGMIFNIVGTLSDDQWDELERQLEGRSGAEGAGKNIIIEGEKGTTVTPYNFSPAEMDWLEGNRDTARRICYSFGVPPVLMGIPGDSTYNNQREARQAFWDTTVLYYLNLYRGEFNNWLIPKGSGLYLNYNLDDIPAMEYRRDQKWKRAQESDFLTINEKRDLAGYESKGDEGDVILVPANMIPLGMTGLEGEEAGTEEGIEEGEIEEGTEEEKRMVLRRLGYSGGDIDEFLEDPARLMQLTHGAGNGNGSSEMLRQISDSLLKLLEKEHVVNVTLPEIKPVTIVEARPGGSKRVVRNKDGEVIGVEDVPQLPHKN